MAVYIIIEIFLFLSIYARRKRRTIYCFWIFILTLLSSVRSITVGGDLRTYEATYIRYHDIPWINIIKDPNYSFAMYCKILNVIGLGTRGFLVVTAVLFAVLLAVAIRANEADGLLSLSLFWMMGLYIQSFSMLRQTFANVIFLIAYAGLNNSKATENRIMNDMKAALLYIVAIGFHTATVLMISIPLISRFYRKAKDIRPQRFLRDGIVLFGAVLVSFRGIFPVILKYFPYKYRMAYGRLGTEGFGNIGNGALLIIIYTIFYICYKKHYKELSRKDAVLVGSTITIAYAFSSMSVISKETGRLNLFVEYLMVVMLSKIMKQTYRKKWSNDWIYLTAYFVYFVMYIVRNSIGVVPYSIGI